MEGAAAYYSFASLGRAALAFVPAWLLAGLWMALSLRAEWREAGEPRLRLHRRRDRDLLSLPTLLILLVALHRLWGLFNYVDHWTPAGVVSGVWETATAALTGFLVLLLMAGVATAAAPRWVAERSRRLPRLSAVAMLAAADVCAIWLLVGAACHVFYGSE